MTYSIIDRVTGEEVGVYRYRECADAEEHAADLRATTHPRAPEMPRRNVRRR